VLGRLLGDRGVAADPGVGDEQAQAAEALDRARDGGGDQGLVGDVGAHREALAAGRVQLARQLFERRGRAGEDGHPAAAPGEVEGDGPADPRRGAGDQAGSAALEPHGAAPGPSAATR
jgi:hypothetical protein